MSDQSDTDAFLRRNYKEIHDPLKQLVILVFLGLLAILAALIKLEIISAGASAGLLFPIIFFLLSFYVLKKRKCTSCKNRMTKVFTGSPGSREIIYFCDDCGTKISTYAVSRYR